MLHPNKDAAALNAGDFSSRMPICPIRAALKGNGKKKGHTGGREDSVGKAVSFLWYECEDLSLNP